MTLLSSALNRRIVSRTDCKIIGDIENVYFDKKCKKIEYFVVLCSFDAEYDNSILKVLLPFNAIASFGDAVVVEDSAVFYKTDDIDLSYFTDNWTDKPVYTAEGDYKGAISDVGFDARGKTEKIYYTGGVLDPTDFEGFGEIAFLKSRKPISKNRRRIPRPKTETKVTILNETELNNSVTANSTVDCENNSLAADVDNTAQDAAVNNVETGRVNYTESKNNATAEQVNIADWANSASSRTLGNNAVDESYDALNISATVSIALSEYVVCQALKADADKILASAANTADVTAIDAEENVILDVHSSDGEFTETDNEINKKCSADSADEKFTEEESFSSAATKVVCDGKPLSESAEFAQNRPPVMLDDTMRGAIEEDDHTPYRIICNYDFLLGRKLVCDLKTYIGEIISEAGSEVTDDIVEKARKSGKLIDLILNSK